MLLRDQNGFQIERDQQRNIAKHFKNLYERLLKEVEERAQKQQNISKDANTGNLPMSRTMRSNVSYNDDNITQYTRPESIGGSIYGDIMEINAKKFNGKPSDPKQFEEFKGNKRPYARVPTIVSDFGEAEPQEPIKSNLIPDDVAEKLDPEPGDEDPLPPFKVTEHMNFPEFCRRWRVAQRDEMERQRLLSYV